MPPLPLPCPQADTAEERTELNVKNKTGIFFVCGVGLLAAFALWTIAVGCIDVQPIGPDGSSVGFAAMKLLMYISKKSNFTMFAYYCWVVGAAAVIFA